MLFNRSHIVFFMGLKNKNLMFIFFGLLIILASCDEGTTPQTFVNSEWTSDKYDIVGLGNVVVTGNEVTPPVTDEDMTQLILTIGEASNGQCACSGGTLISHICFDSEVPVCSGDSCDCTKTANYCPGGTSVPLTISCADPIYDPAKDTGSGSLANNACCEPGTVNENECESNSDCSASQECRSGSCVDRNAWQCTYDWQCSGALVCISGSCTDAEGPGPEPTCNDATKPTCNGACSSNTYFTYEAYCVSGSWSTCQLTSTGTCGAGETCNQGICIPDILV